LSGEKQNNESLMSEFETTQDMIKHYDTLNLHFGIITETSVFILIGLAFGLLGKDTQKFIQLFPFVIVLVLILHAWYFAWFMRHRRVTRIKLHRILQIEKELGWQQFTLVDQALKSKKEKTIPNWTMLMVYLVSIPFVLIISYFVVLLS
jgi:hypothetical protein